MDKEEVKPPPKPPVEEKPKPSVEEKPKSLDKIEDNHKEDKPKEIEKKGPVSDISALVGDD